MFNTGYSWGAYPSSGQGFLNVEHSDTGEKFHVPIDEAKNLAQEMLEIVAETEGRYWYLFENFQELRKVEEAVNAVEKIREALEEVDFVEISNLKDELDDLYRPEFPWNLKNNP